MKIIANPSSRSGKGKKLWPFWTQTLCKHNVAFSWHETLSETDCQNQAAESDKTVVAVGGDGTINNVINGMMSTGAKHSLGILYAGTSPDFCRFHNIPTQKAAALATLLARHEKAIDIVSLTLAQDNGKPAQKYFACSANIGLGAQIARFANIWRKYLGDTLGTGIGLIRAIIGHSQFSASLSIDGKKQTFSQVNHIILLKNPYIASSLRLGCDNRPDDGNLLLIVIHGYSRWGLLGIIANMYTGTLLKRRGIFAKHCRQVALFASPRQEVEFDGDPHGFTPLDATIHPKALSLICGGES